MNRLISAIKAAKVTPIYVTMPMEPFNRIITPGKVRTKCGSAYTLCCQKAMLLCRNYADLVGDEGKISYVFDSGHRNEGDFQYAYDIDQKGRNEFSIGSLQFCDECNLPPLQAADLLAYECFQNLSGRTSRYPWKKLVIEADVREYTYTEEALQMSVRNKFR